jgi:putative (di)nucleoside polyphosphate hydrolase
MKTKFQKMGFLGKKSSELVPADKAAKEMHLSNWDFVNQAVDNLQYREVRGRPRFFPEDVIGYGRALQPYREESKGIIDKLYQKKEYRPVGVAVLYNPEGKFFLVQSAKDENSWYFPQGGIDEGEDLEENIGRELKEEVGFEGEDIYLTNKAFFKKALNAEKGRKDKRGFTKGKCYFASLGLYGGPGKVQLNLDEVTAGEWMDYNSAVNHFRKGRPEKAELLEKILDDAVDILQEYKLYPASAKKK